MTARLSFIFRIVLGGIFIIAGLAKISDPVRFLITIRYFQISPDIINPFLAIYIPWLEFILGLFIMLGILHRTSSLILSCLNGIFTLAILSVIIRGIEIDCGCFGLLADILKIPDMADYKAIIRNLIFISMGISIFKIKNTVLSIENYLKKT
jgi:uncharacterized membrane protein YphA (DoxX/SURF4 family)